MKQKLLLHETKAQSMWCYVGHIRRCAHADWSLHLVSSCLALCRQGRAFGGTAPKADMAQLSKALNEVVDQLRPSQEEQERQKAAFEQVRSTLLHQWPEAKVHLFGSTANCLSICNNNDIDVCLELPEGIEDQVANAPALLAYCAVLRAATALLQNFSCTLSDAAPVCLLCHQYHSTCSLLEDTLLRTVINHGVFQLCCTTFLQLMTLRA